MTWELKMQGLKEAAATVAAFGKEFAEAKRTLLKEAGVEMEREMRRRIHAQDLGRIAPLKVSTLERKKRGGWDRRTFIQVPPPVGYAGSITSGVTPLGTIKLFAKGMDPITRQPYWQIAWRLEMGTKRGQMRPRPHWSPLGAWAQLTLLPKYAARIATAAMKAAMKKERAEPAR